MIINLNLLDKNYHKDCSKLWCVIIYLRSIIGMDVNAKPTWMDTRPEGSTLGVRRLMK